VKVLLLGGTGEARSLAARLAECPGLEVVSSLAGRVRDPALPVGAVRVGGFGGVAGLGRYLRDEGVQAVVDATHPFAATITDHAARACAEVGVPRLVLRRPGWSSGPGDVWHWVESIEQAPAAVAALCGPDGCVFLTTGRRDLAVFADDPSREYLVRVVDPPGARTPARMELLCARGPYTVEGERELMRSRGVRLLVTKDSGGAMTSAKLVAARELQVPVVVVARPVLPADSTTVTEPSEAVRWLEAAGTGTGAADPR
jgi:precorrin-6A/cobalt-precorrin-6A reductase